MTGTDQPTAEHARLADHAARRADWKRWGPYLSERAWGTVREDYSEGGDAWRSFPHEHARSRAYRWNEDGLAGVSDRNQYLCFALALWNGRDPILKERLFGLTGNEGNHGEDVKECYWYLDSTPTHSSMRMLYRYPHAEFPYAELIEENARRTRRDPEFELTDSGVFAEDRYFDVEVEYAKAGETDLLVNVTISNRGPERADCTVLPTVWFRNTWSWGYPSGPMVDVPERPSMREVAVTGGTKMVRAEHPAAGTYRFYAEDAERLLFTENDTNAEKLWEEANEHPWVKDAFHRYVVDGDEQAVNPERRGTKAAAHYELSIPPGEERVLRLRLTTGTPQNPFAGFNDVLRARRREADEFYDGITPPALDEDERRIHRQAYAGLLWSKQLYYYDVPQWLRGDPSGPTPPPARRSGRNRHWMHLNNFDVLSMPDVWEYPWYAAWDLAFHCIPLAAVDAEFAKRQLRLLTREWYMHPNGQLPAYEWSFGDTNPPVHAWATWRVYQIDAQRSGEPDRAFLEGMFHKLLLNFTWWVNRKDVDGNNVFQGGFLGLDNISVFDRTAELPGGGHLDQSDGTAWMGFFTLSMLEIALELARDEPVYQDIATKFFEHFLAIAAAMTDDESDHCLWDPDDGFFYDVLHLPDGSVRRLGARSLVGLIPLLAVTVVEPEVLSAMGDFARRMAWFVAHRPEIAGDIAAVDVPGEGERYLVSLLPRERLESLLRYMLDEAEFLAPHGVRSLSKVHAEHPFSVELFGEHLSVEYEPAESNSPLYGGNSNWRGPVWFPLGFLIVESLRNLHRYYGERLRVEFPTGSGRTLTLDQVASRLSERMIDLFRRDAEGRRAVFGRSTHAPDDPLWNDHILFYEYFDGDTGAGLGASHQTGWTALVATLLEDEARSRHRADT